MPPDGEKDHGWLEETAGWQTGDRDRGGGLGKVTRVRAGEKWCYNWGNGPQGVGGGFGVKMGGQY